MNDRRLLLMGIPVVSVLAMLFRGVGHIHGVPEALLNWLISLVYTSIFWLGNRALWFALLRRFAQVEQTNRRLWRVAAASLGFSVVAALVLDDGLNLLLFGQHLTVAKFGTELMLDLLPTGIVLLIYESRHFFQQWETNVRRADQLARAGTQAQLDALQAQLDPHFLFNNLNTLSALIEPGNQPAQDFVDQLADVYRYVLQAQGRATVPLAEELAFVDSYLALHRTRFGDKLLVAVQVAAPARHRLVAPLSVQLLVENALKHNIATRQQPLHLRIAATPDALYLTVENTFQPRQAGLAPGTGTGLANVRRRYELLHAARPVVVTAQAGHFTVQLPLL